MSADFEQIEKLAKDDVLALKLAEQSYGDSWKSRGGNGAFMMLARKWDRINNQSKYTVTSSRGEEVFYWDIFQAIEDDPSPTGIFDDIQDLRRYLLLVESEVRTLLGSEFNEDIPDGDAESAYVDQD